PLRVQAAVPPPSAANSQVVDPVCTTAGALNKPPLDGVDTDWVSATRGGAARPSELQETNRRVLPSLRDVAATEKNGRSRAKIGIAVAQFRRIGRCVI